MVNFSPFQFLQESRHLWSIQQQYEMVSNFFHVTQIWVMWLTKWVSFSLVFPPFLGLHSPKTKDPRGVMTYGPGFVPRLCIWFDDGHRSLTWNDPLETAWSRGESDSDILRKRWDFVTFWWVFIQKLGEYIIYSMILLMEVYSMILLMEEIRLTSWGC